MNQSIQPLALLAALLLNHTAHATPATDRQVECAQQARSVVEQMRARGQLERTSDRYSLAYEAAFASCIESQKAHANSVEARPIASAATETSDPLGIRAEERTALQRFWAGLISTENKKVKKRAGRYRYSVDQ